MNWWDAVLRPLKELESGATNCVDQRAMMNSSVSTRSSLEDMELETRALTEPLPTNQQVRLKLLLVVVQVLYILSLQNAFHECSPYGYL